MSRPFFTRFVVIGNEYSDGGTIETGDYIFSNNSILRYGAKTKDYSILQVNKLLNWYRKTTLFLCSKDIQVGDTVYNEGYPDQRFPILVVADGVTQADHPDIQVYRMNQIRSTHYKIIGEVSKDAIWVMANEAYEEADVEYQIYDGVQWYRALNKTQFDNAETKKRIAIKCPCCDTFK